VAKRGGLPLRLRALAAALGLCACALLAGCSSISHVIADHWPRALGGLPEGVPARPENPSAYTSVFDRPPTRDSTKMTNEERAKLEADLKAGRSENTTQAEEVRSQSPRVLPPIH
jgi:hypothetical protein